MFEIFGRCICWLANKIIPENQNWCSNILLIKNKNIKQINNKNILIKTVASLLSPHLFNSEPPRLLVVIPFFSPVSSHPFLKSPLLLQHCSGFLVTITTGQPFFSYSHFFFVYQSCFQDLDVPFWKCILLFTFGM